MKTRDPSLVGGSLFRVVLYPELLLALGADIVSSGLPVGGRHIWHCRVQAICGSWSAARIVAWRDHAAVGR